ncbi:MAG: hypothetical protein O3A06_03475 [Proteobacteria bacterium]|nr:hypothetical protein [Pseudomonadota bacterium]
MSHSMLVAESALVMHSYCVISPAMNILNSGCSKLYEPGAMLFSIASLISFMSPFSISSLTGPVLSSTSTAARRAPAPSSA